MATFASKITTIPGLRFITDSLQLMSGIGRQLLLKQSFMVTDAEIKFQLDKVSLFYDILKKGGTPDLINNLKHKLSEVHDITGTLNMLQSVLIPDDIGLFEIKRFALITVDISLILEQLTVESIKLKDPAKVISVLDPDNQRIPQFFIYNTYSPELTLLRNQYRQLINNDIQQAERIRLQAVEIEDKIREDLSDQIRPLAGELLESLNLIANIDLWLAKAILALELNLCKPMVTEGFTSYKELFNPQVAHMLTSVKKRFQAIDIDIYKSVCLITGANMAGKTVFLKTIALAQYMFQYGFYVPAASAHIVPVNHIMISMEDQQSELKGLSSFAAGMLNINDIIKAAKAGKNILALVDEPARTTNPKEGLCLVNALVDLLEKYHVPGLVTTHYSGIQSKCRRLRVKGLRTEQLTEKPTIETINDYMDYSLIEVQTDEVPHEALRIASILNIDTELIELASHYLETTGNIKN